MMKFLEEFAKGTVDNVAMLEKVLKENGLDEWNSSDESIKVVPTDFSIDFYFDGKINPKEFEVVDYLEEKDMPKGMRIYKRKEEIGKVYTNLKPRKEGVNYWFGCNVDEAVAEDLMSFPKLVIDVYYRSGLLVKPSNFMYNEEQEGSDMVRIYLNNGTIKVQKGKIGHIIDDYYEFLPDKKTDLEIAKKYTGLVNEIFTKIKTELA